MFEYLQKFKNNTVEISLKKVNSLQYAFMRFKSSNEAEAFQHAHIDEFKANNLSSFQVSLMKPVDLEEIEAYYEKHGAIPDSTPEGGLVVIASDQCHFPSLPELYFSKNYAKLTATLNAIWKISEFSFLFIGEEVVYCYFDQDLPFDKIEYLVDFIYNSQSENYFWSFSKRDIREALKSRKFYLGPE